VIVQCKHWPNRRVAVQRVRELLGVVTAEGADRGIFVATGGFMADALEFVVGKPLQLLDGEALVQLAKTAGEQAAPAEDPETTAGEMLTCPDCGKAMVRRTALRGPRKGSQFWGCPSYPACSGIRAA
jgi:restriction system protein